MTRKMEGSGSAWAKEKAINEAGARREGCWWGREETRTGWRYGLLNKPQAQPRGKEEKCQSLVRECFSVCTYYEYICIFVCGCAFAPFFPECRYFGQRQGQCLRRGVFLQVNPKHWPLYLPARSSRAMGGSHVKLLRGDPHAKGAEILGL